MKASPAEGHESLLKVERREYKCLGSGFGVWGSMFWVDENGFGRKYFQMKMFLDEFIFAIQMKVNLTKFDMFAV